MKIAHYILTLAAAASFTAVTAQNAPERTAPERKSKISAQTRQEQTDRAINNLAYPRRARFDRGLAFDTRTPSMPKGMWVAGIGGAYSNHDNNDYGVAILDALDSRGSTLTVSPMVHYVFANNQSVGVRFRYSHSLFDMSDATLHLTPELSEMLFGDGTLKYRYESDGFMGIVSYRYYVGLGRQNKRMLFFNEIQAGVGGGSGREDSGATDAGNFKRTMHQKSLDVRLGFSPGVTFFVTNSTAIELQIGLLGYEFHRVRQQSATAATTPGEIGAPTTPGSRTTHSASARFDIMSIAFGATFYL